jgi:squalene cyclase
VVAALDWLAKHQNADGSWSAEKHEYDVGVTALAILAFARARRATDDAARRGLRWLAAQQDAEGCVGPRSAPKYMYGHLVAAAALAEASPTSPLVRHAAQRALHFTLAAQNPGKGWRYLHRSGDNDSSVTGWAVLSLRSAEQAGLAVPASAYDGAVAWFDEVTDENYFRSGYTHRGTGKVFSIGPNENFNTHNTCTAIAIYSRRQLQKDDPRERGGFP